MVFLYQTLLLSFIFCLQHYLCSFFHPYFCWYKIQHPLRFFSNFLSFSIRCYPLEPAKNTHAQNQTGRRVLELEFQWLPLRSRHVVTWHAKNDQMVAQTNRWKHHILRETLLGWVLFVCCLKKWYFSILFYSILFFYFLFYYILFYSALFYSTWFSSIFFYSILFHSILFYSNSNSILVLFCSFLVYSTLFILFYSTLFYSSLFYSILL